MELPQQQSSEADKGKRRLSLGAWGGGGEAHLVQKHRCKLQAVVENSCVQRVAANHVPRAVGSHGVA